MSHTDTLTPAQTLNQFYLNALADGPQVFRTALANDAWLPLAAYSRMIQEGARDTDGGPEAWTNMSERALFFVLSSIDAGTPTNIALSAFDLVDEWYTRNTDGDNDVYQTIHYAAIILALVEASQAISRVVPMD